MATRPTQQYLKGQTIIEEGEKGDHTFKIVNGEVVVCLQNKHKELVPIAKLGQGEIFGEMYLFENNGRRTATVVASSNYVEVEVYFKDEMDYLLNSLNPAAMTLMKGFSKRLSTTTRSCADLVKDERYTKLPDGTVKQTGMRIQRDPP